MIRMVVPLTFLVLASGCSSQGNVRVHSYWGTTLERPPVGTVYEWSADSSHLESGQDEGIAAAVTGDTEAELNAMGFEKRMGSQTPDILIAIHWGRGLQPSPSGPEQRATVAVRVYDASTGRVIYCASADALIEPTLTPEDRRARLNLAIHEILLPLDPRPDYHRGRCRLCD